LISGEGCGNSKGDTAALSERTQLVKFFEFCFVFANPYLMQGDAPLTWALKAANSRKAAAVSHCRQEEFILDGTISETVNAVGHEGTNAVGNVITPANDLVGTE
jgi:hypothetical protein